MKYPVFILNCFCASQHNPAARKFAYAKRQASFVTLVQSKYVFLSRQCNVFITCNGKAWAISNENKLQIFNSFTTDIDVFQMKTFLHGTRRYLGTLNGLDRAYDAINPLFRTQSRFYSFIFFFFFLFFYVSNFS